MTLSKRLKFLFSDNRRASVRGPQTRSARYAGSGKPATPVVDVTIYAHSLGNLASRNEAYITRDSSIGQAREGEQRIIGTDPDVKQWNADDYHYMVVVSLKPEWDVSLDKVAQQMVTDMQQDLGTELDWKAAVHRNTQNPHFHMMVRGKDDKGRNLEIRTRYLHKVLAQIAKERVTAALTMERKRGLLRKRDNTRIRDSRTIELSRT